MKIARFGPTGALITTVETDPQGVRLRLFTVLPVIANLAIQVRLLGRDRIELADPASRSEFQQEGRPFPDAEDGWIRRAVELVQRVRMPNTRLASYEVWLPQRVLRQTRYLAVYAGSRDDRSEATWEQSEDTFVLEAKKADLRLDANQRPSFFLLMTRGDATQRLELLQQSDRVLQSQDEATADALFDIYFLLIGGRDFPLMTCELED
ncbi:hypothetical protein [Fuerstiella marisgermanici]|uniref:Uncharacterized protein n=1 Tax=Fuerstiella marisgermanici TaxID=1891926 RepID=A0A1P8WKG7_9PLAN|nr:hypothetical protein [Fuerstiella marisgermanici]APZ94546.1 hypothetical protein Fuma_04178 [Fuerstiella marisgermanici]